MERHRQLRGGVIEPGAGRVPDRIRRLDHAAAIRARADPRLAETSRTAGEQILFFHRNFETLCPA